MFDWKWYLSDLKQDKPVKVFSCFSCGGGSSMGYKRAGFEVIGNCEIDPRMNNLYVKNNHPKYNYCMDLRDFNRLDDLPEELFHLDILDGSPPCSTFSTAGLREKVWNKEKVFREGQRAQILDDLFFVFLETVEKLQPKIVVAENVTGLLKGNAKGYVNEILRRFKELGYDVQLFKLNAATMNVPQRRERVFFIANNQGFKKLHLNFNEKPITFKEVRSEKGRLIDKNLKTYEKLKHMRPTDTSLSDITFRINGKLSDFNTKIWRDNEVASTMPASGNIVRAYDKSWVSDEDYRHVQTFPEDYDFSPEQAKYVCGMSVPPNMMAHIATQIYEQWLK